MQRMCRHMRALLRVQINFDELSRLFLSRIFEFFAQDATFLRHTIRKLYFTKVKSRKNVNSPARHRFQHACQSVI